MAQLRQQYLDILQGYGVDPAGLRSATDAQLKRILQQTAQGRDIGGEMASGAAAGQQAAKDVIGGTTPVQSLESLLAAAHTGAPIASQAAPAADLPMSQATPTALDRDLRIRGDRTSMAVTGRSQEPTPVSTPLVPGWQPTEELVAEQHTLPAGKRVAAETADLPMSEATVQSIEQVEPRKEFGPTHSEYAAETERLGQLMKPDRTPMAITGRLQEPTPVSTPLVDEPALPAAPKQGILSRIGQYAKENPDIALAGMEGVGNLLANIGAARGQRKADEATQQGMARSNLISALTGGRVRPAVAEETPEMGLLGRVGQAVGTAGKLGREVEQERAARGFKQQEADRKAADLDRKIDADALKLRKLIGDERLDEARIEKWINENSRGLTKNEIARYRAEVYDRLGTGQLDLDRDKFAQAQAEFDFVKQMDLRGMDVKEAALKINEDKMKLAWQGAQREYEMQMKKFGLDVKRVEALEKDVETRAKRAASYAEQVALNTMTARGEQKREVRKIIDGLDGKQLNRMMDPKQGTAAIMQGLNAAYRDFQVDPNQANMNAVFQMYQRLFDPATVREGDLAIQREGQGEILRAIASMERLSGGGFVIARSVIEDMREIAGRYAESARKSATNTLNNYIENAVLGTDPTPLETAQAEAIRNYYTSIWSYDPLKDQTVSGTAGNTGDAAQTGETGDVADDFVKRLQ